MDWLESLGSTHIDWKQMTMAFNHKGTQVEFQAMNQGELKMSEGPEIYYDNIGVKVVN